MDFIVFFLKSLTFAVIFNVYDVQVLDQLVI